MKAEIIFITSIYVKLEIFLKNEIINNIIWNVNGNYLSTIIMLHWYLQYLVGLQDFYFL